MNGNKETEKIEEPMGEDDEAFAAAYHKQFEDLFAFIEQNNVRVKDAVEMRLADGPFEQIRSGEKTVEVRLYDEKRRGLCEGDEILFYREDRSECIRGRVKALHRAPTFAELFAVPGMLSKAGFPDMPPSDAVICMRKYYSEEQEKECGTLGIELCDLRQETAEKTTNTTEGEKHMTEKEVTERLRTCIQSAFECYLGEVGENAYEDGEMFFEDGYFHILLHDGRLCRTTYTADDFRMIRFRRAEDDATQPYVVIYMKNGDRLYYNNFEWAEYCKTTWELFRIGQKRLEDDAIFGFFETV